MTFLEIKVMVGYLLDDLKYLFMSDSKFNKKIFKRKKGYDPDFANPSLFSEKLLYLKEHYRNPLQTMCTDKYFVKEYLSLCGCKEIGKKIYGVYPSVDAIDFSVLPDEFFIHCNHMSGRNFIFRKDYDESKKKQILNLLRISMKHNWYHSNREWNYKNIEPLVICEECLRTKDGALPIDYKFYCFSGEPKYWMVSYGEYDHQVRNHKFDMNCKSIDHYFKKSPTLLEKEAIIPNNFEEMVSYVKMLCKPFPHVRVDLYDIEGRIVLGELTFFSDTGVVNIYSKDFEKEIGSWIQLEKYRENMI